MERGREGRRGSGGGGAISAPRRPRTSGFKDTSVGEDGEDIMDDAHNPRLRERQKKENCTLHPAQALPPSNLGPSRSKRKRQGSQEIQDQARSSALDDVDETTEEMEMDGSDDDDDPPPPPIPRRAVKFRPQGKFLEDGLTADLPAVPRKARTAILKRPQEAASVSVAEASSHQGSAIPRAPASSSAPSSSSVVSLKPGRRTKPISSKLRAAKVCKISTQTMISEQEVEVAEALFDLARMFTSQPVSTALEPRVNAVHSCKPEREPNCEPEVKFEPKALANFTVAPSLLPPQSSASVSESMTVLCVTSSQNSTNPPSAVSISPPTISTASPAAATFTDSAITVTSPRPFPSPPPSIVVPPAEAPKRKRPRFKNRSDEVGLVSQVPPQGISAVPRSSSVFTSPSSKLKSEQTVNSVAHLTAESIVKMEISARPFAASSAVSASMTPPGIPPALDLSTICTSVVARISNSADKISGLSGNVVKEEANNSSMPQEKYLGRVPDQRPAPVPECIRSPQADLMRETEGTLHNLSGSVSLASLELGKRYVQLPNSANDEVGTNKLEIDLKVPLSAKRTLPPESDNTDVSRNATQHVQEKGSVCLPSAALREDIIIDKERVEETHIEEREPHWGRELGKEPRPELERDREREGERQEEEGDNHSELPKELEKELEGAESGKSPPEQKFVKALMADSRTENSQRAASAATTAAASSSLLSALSVATSASGSVPTLPLSVGMATWPLGLPPVGYYSSGAAVATNVNWPGGGPISGLPSVDEHIAPTVQFPHQYLMQARHPQPWKRCASHVYIAHFIDAQQQMNRHPFIQAAYQNSSSLFGGKSYNLNIPLTPAEALFGAGSGGPLIGGASTAAGDNVVAGGGSCPGLGGVPGTDKNPNASSVKASAQAKDRVFMESVSRKQVVQQLHQPLQISPNLSLQARPGFGFPVAQVGTAGAAAAANGGGTLGDPESGGGSTLGGQSSGPTSCSTTATGLGTGAGNGGVVSHATAQAQYLQAVMQQQGAFPFPFQATAHFGPGFSGPGPQQAAQYFSSPFYATHMVHTPTHAQQQVQKASTVSAGFVTNDLQHQQVARNFPPGTSSQQQQQPSPPSASPSLSQQIQTQLSTSQKMQRLVERDGNSGSESNSTNESKIPSLQRNVFTQGSCNVTASVNPPSSMVLGGTAGIHCLQPQDFNLIPGLGGKPTKHLRPSQSASQHLSPLQQQLQQPHQHVGTGAAVQMSLKCTDQQSSHTFSAMPVAAMTRVSTIGPGPLGLAPVASVMAPQGHAMLQSITDSCRSHGQQQTQHHQAVIGQSHQISLPPGQQQQRVGQPQRGVTIATGVEEGRPVVEGTVFPNRSGREVIDERKALSKRSSGSALPRVDLDNSVAIQGPPTCGGHPTARMSSNAGPALNLLTSTPAILITRSPGHLTGSSLQQSSPSLALIQSSKQATARSKVVAGSIAGNSVTSTSSQLASFADRCPLGSSLSNKVLGTTLSLPGQSLAQGSQGLRQGQVTQQHPQLKLSNRGSVGSLPTPSGTAPQAVLAAAIAKSQQGVQQQQPRPQAQVSSNTGSLPRLSSGNLGGLSTSSSVPAKGVPPCTAKINLSGKNSFPVSQRPSSAVSGKRPTPPSVSNVSSVLGPLIQTASTKCQQQPSQNQPLCQQPQNLSQCHTQASQQSPQTLQQSPSQPPQSLTPTHQQYLHQQGHCSTQQLHQMHNQQSLTQPHHMQRQLFLQNPAFQQHQHPAGSQLSSHPQQQVGLRQQSQQQSSHVQTHQQGNLSSSQLQLQPQQHHASPQQHQQHGLQSGPGSLSVKIPSGSLSLGPPVLTLGTGSNGKINNSCWTPGSDGVAASQCSVARSNPATSKVSGSSGITPPGSNLQRSQCGPFLHGQFGSVVSGQQQSSSPQSSSGPQYVQPVANSGGSGIAVDEIGMSGGSFSRSDWSRRDYWDAYVAKSDKNSKDHLDFNRCQDGWRAVSSAVKLVSDQLLGINCDGANLDAGRKLSLSESPMKRPFALGRQGSLHQASFCVRPGAITSREVVL